MDHAKVIDTADQIHACLQRLQPMSGIPTAPGQGGQTLAERGIQSFNKRGIEHTSSVRLCQEFLGPVECSLGHASSDLDDPLVPSVFDDGGDQKLRPRLQGGSSSANGALDLFAKRAPNTAGIGSPAIGANQKWSQRLAARSDLPQQPISQASISAEAESSCKPQAGRNHHGQAHPGDHLSPFDSDLIGLNMDQVKSSLLDYCLMQPLAVIPGSISPPRHGSLIESKGVDNRLDRTAIREQGNHHHNELRWLAQPFHHGSTPGTKRVTAAATAIALPLAIMDANVALPDLASCRTRLVWAKLSGRVHWLFCCLLHTPTMPRTVAFFKMASLFHRLGVLYQTLAARIQNNWNSTTEWENAHNVAHGKEQQS